MNAIYYIHHEWVAFNMFCIQDWIDSLAFLLVEYKFGCEPKHTKSSKQRWWWHQKCRLTISSRGFNVDLWKVLKPMTLRVDGQVLVVLGDCTAIDIGKATPATITCNPPIMDHILAVMMITLEIYIIKISNDLWSLPF